MDKLNSHSKLQFLEISLFRAFPHTADHELHLTYNGLAALFANVFLNSNSLTLKMYKDVDHTTTETKINKIHITKY
jgi:hypothetical protein